jgi:hypothetical protein
MPEKCLSYIGTEGSILRVSAPAFPLGCGGYFYFDVAALIAIRIGEHGVDAIAPVR